MAVHTSPRHSSASEPFVFLLGAARPHALGVDVRVDELVVEHEGADEVERQVHDHEHEDVLHARLEQHLRHGRHVP